MAKTKTETAEQRDTLVMRVQLTPAEVKRLRTRAAREETTTPVLVGQLVRDGLKAKAAK